MSQALQKYEENKQYLEDREIDKSTWNALCTTIYPGALAESVLMVIDYCAARSLDVMLKPVHLVPMNVMDAQTKSKTWRDVVMPGIGLYRIQADRSDNYAGADEPEFGPTKTIEGVDGYDNPYKVEYPEWCKYTVHKVVGDRVVAFTAKEYWLENYATQSAKTQSPNAMWKKRPFAQLAKCAEAQALRKGWPEIGSIPTADEMEGKDFYDKPDLKVVNDSPEYSPSETTIDKKEDLLPEYPAKDFAENLNKWVDLLNTKMKTADDIISMVSTKYKLSEKQEKEIRSFE